MLLELDRGSGSRQVCKRLGEARIAMGGIGLRRVAMCCEESGSWYIVKFQVSIALCKSLDLLCGIVDLQSLCRDPDRYRGVSAAKRGRDVCSLLSCCLLRQRQKRQ